MSVNLEAIIGHQMSKQTLLGLPAMLDKLSDNEDIKSPAKWNYDYEMTEEILEAIWQDWEKEEVTSISEVFDNAIQCSFGRIDVWRNTIIISRNAHHYYNLCDPVKAEKLLHANRIIAGNLNATKILYTTDSAYPTSAIIDKAQLGLDVNELIQFGIQQFGNPPKPVAECMKYMFFIDEIAEDIGVLQEWNIQADCYWNFNSAKSKYELKSL